MTDAELVQAGLDVMALCQRLRRPPSPRERKVAERGRAAALRIREQLRQDLTTAGSPPPWDPRLDK